MQSNPTLTTERAKAGLLSLEVVRRRLLLRGTGLTTPGFDDKRFISASSICRRQTSSVRHRIKKERADGK